MRITYVFKLYNASRNKTLHRAVDTCGEIWNYCIGYINHYYEQHNKLISKYDLQRHLTLIKKQEPYVHWAQVGSQAIQNITDRIYLSYSQFFLKRKKGMKASPPSFKKIKKYKSLTLKQAGYKLLEGNKIRIGNKVYQYHKSREIKGDINTVTIKRDKLGDIYLFITCTVEDAPAKKSVTSGNIVGIDFGLKTFLTLSDGTVYTAPLYYTQGLQEFRKAGKEFSTKQKGSHNKEKAYYTLCRRYKKVSNQRHDFFHKLAKELTEKYDVICIEDFNIAGMKRLWGRKVSDLAFTKFVSIVKHHCEKSGTKLIMIDRFYPSSKQCHRCFELHEDLGLQDRIWTCALCRTTHDRDYNAAKNIERVGASTLGVGDVSPTLLAIAV